jgi:hypothetical protein
MSLSALARLTGSPPMRSIPTIAVPHSIAGLQSRSVAARSTPTTAQWTTRLRAPYGPWMKIYNRARYEGEMREALTKWAQHVAAITTPVP